jgi:hypothetical protein
MLLRVVLVVIAVMVVAWLIGRALTYARRGRR